MVKLIRLELEGFGCFKDKTVFEYEDGINLVKAENGHGKTTQMEAVEIMLLSNYEGAFADYMNRDCDDFTISLEFYLDKLHLLETLTCKKGKTYTTSRNLKDLESGLDLANGEGVKEWLNERLPLATSKYALFVRQNSDKDDIIKCSDSERRDLFKRIQDLDFSKEIDSFIEPKIKQTKDKIIETDKEIFALENKDYVIKSFLELPFSEDEYNLKKNKLETLNAQKALAEERKARFEELLLSKQNMMSDITTNQGLIKGRKSDIEKCDVYILQSEQNKKDLLKKCATEKAEIENHISSYKSDINNLGFEKENKIKELNDLITRGENALTENESEASNIKLVKLIKFDESPLIKARNDLSELKTKMNIAWKNANILKTGICPTCGRSGCEEKYQEFADEAVSYEKMIAECEGAIVDLNSKKEEYEENTKKNQTNKERKLELDGKITQIKEYLDKKRNELTNLDTLYESKKNYIDSLITNEEQKYYASENKCNSDIKAIDDKVEMTIKQRADYEQMIETYETKIENLSKELIEVNAKLGKYTDEMDDFSECISLENEIKTYDSVISQNKVIKEYNENVEITKKEDKEKLEKFKEKKTKFEKEKYDLESSKKILLRDYPNWYISNSIEHIEQDVNDFIEQVYYKSLNVKFESTKSGIKMTFGKDIPIKRMSGAESKLVTVAFCHSFNKALKLNLIFMDEVDAPLAEKLKPKFYEILLEMKSIFNQIILVSHSNLMHNFIQANDGDCNIIEL